MPVSGPSIATLLFLAAIPGASAQTASSQVAVPDWCRKLPRPEYSILQRVPVHDPWFEVYRVAPRVLAIYEPHQWEETIMYLVEGAEKALLFDTGLGIGDLHAVVSELTKLPVIVVNSHTHPDHTGGNWQFDTIYNLDSDYTRNHAKGSTEIRAEIEPQKLCGPLPKSFNPAAYATKPWQTTRWLHDGDTIDLGSRTLQVLATPGHAPDSISLFDEKASLLFTGDTYYPGPLYIFGPGSDPAAYQKSLDRLATLTQKVRLVFGAHNAPASSTSVLPELSREFTDLRAGKLSAKETENGVTKYEGLQFTFLVDANSRDAK